MGVVVWVPQRDGDRIDRLSISRTPQLVWPVLKHGDQSEPERVESGRRGGKGSLSEME